MPPPGGCEGAPLTRPLDDCPDEAVRFLQPRLYLDGGRPQLIPDEPINFVVNRVPGFGSPTNESSWRLLQTDDLQI